MVKIFEPNKAGRDYVVGDLHGCFTLLETKLVEIGFDPIKDRLFSVGDLVDRGMENERSLEFLAKPWFHAVLGNHEDMLIKWFYSDWPEGNYIRNGGGWLVDKTSKEERQKYVEAFEKLPLAIQVGDIGIIHAEAPTDWNDLVEETYFTTESFIWGRTKISFPEEFSIVRNIRKVYVGHTIVPFPLVKGNTHYIDTGAYSTGSLTIKELS